jgi:hypothetical protein
MSSQIGAVAEVVRTSAQLVDKLESAFDDLGVSDKIPTVREAQQEFAKSLLTYRDTVLRDVLAHAMAQGPDNSHKIGKSTEWGSKRAWVKSTLDTGTQQKDEMSDYLEPFDRWAATLNASGLLRVTPEALYNSRKLAKGKLNLAIVLIEPCNSHDMSYEEMFCQSDTLQEVDQLIRASDSDYTILDVTVLDVTPLVSKEMRDDLLKRGFELDRGEEHAVFEQVMLLKRPDVILALQCQTKNAESPIVKSLCGFTPGTPRPSIIRLQDHEALVFRGFHPSTYLRDDYTANLEESEIERLKKGLRLCFRSAFLALRGKRLVRWNNCITSLRPWSWMCSMIAKEQGLGQEYAKNMSPDHLFKRINLVRVPSLYMYLAKVL